jgi:hypothetical protein
LSVGSTSRTTLIMSPTGLIMAMISSRVMWRRWVRSLVLAAAWRAWVSAIHPVTTLPDDGPTGGLFYQRERLEW